MTHINGTALVFNPADSNYSQAIAIGGGSIKVKADGSYSFTANNPTTSPAPPTSATFTVTDGDGDTATANVSFQVVDANTPTSGTASAAVDDDGLKPRGQPGEHDLRSQRQYGRRSWRHERSDVHGRAWRQRRLDVRRARLLFAALNGTTGDGRHGDGDLQLEFWQQHADGDGDAAPHGTRLFTVVVTNPATGAYKVTLLDNVLHAGGPNEENATDPTTSLNYTITDADGSVATGTLTITFDDDAPTATAEASQNVAEGATVTGTLDFVRVRTARR